MAVETIWHALLQAMLGFLFIALDFLDGMKVT